MKSYSWPGNVRELKNVIERAVILSPGKSLRMDLSMPELKSDDEPATPVEPGGAELMTEKEMREFQKTNLIKALEQADWKVSGNGGAAELLGVRPTTLADRVRTLKIKRPSR
jgi:transcriptional regulator with GAF, ATPase, and Fis domain